MSKQMKATDIIRETVEYYRTNLRGVATTFEGTSCRYNWEDGSHCAVGRCLEKKYQDMGKDMPGNDESVQGLIDRLQASSIDSILQEKYRGHSLVFWRKLQAFHDCPDNWMHGLASLQQNKLTPEGEDEFCRLINLFKVQEQ